MLVMTLLPGQPLGSLYHALELWDWFTSIGTPKPLSGIADDIRALISR